MHLLLISAFSFQYSNHPSSFYPKKVNVRHVKMISYVFDASAEGRNIYIYLVDCVLVVGKDRELLAYGPK
jgi:hypothetical protein